jgi:hypothetical protein
MTPPAPPSPPTQWTAHNAIAYVAGLALFVFGVLTASGVVFPASGTVKIILGIVGAVVGTFVTQVPMLARNSLQKAAVKNGHAPAEASLL